MSDDLLSPNRTSTVPHGRHVPPAVEDACRLARGGAERDAAAAEVAARHGHDRDRLEDAVLFWYRRMHRLPSDDFLATEVLRVLEGALRRIPRTSPPPG